jgi:hypothetical protein
MDNMGIKDYTKRLFEKNKPISKKEQKQAESFYTVMIRKNMTDEECQNVVEYMKIISEEHEKKVTN